MSSYRVFVAAWQQECCGGPFAVGDEVAWTLARLEDETAVLREGMTTEVDGRVDRIAATETGVEVRVVEIADGPTVSWPGEAPPGSRLRTRGLLMEEHHGAVPSDLPVTRGRVRRIFLVTEPYRYSADARAWTPAAGTAGLRELERSPGSFEDDDGERPAQVQTGLLVELELTAG